VRPDPPGADGIPAGVARHTRRDFLTRTSLLATGLPVLSLLPHPAVSALSASSQYPDSNAAASLASLRQDTAGLLLDWARLLAPHYGKSGSMDLDLIDWPTAQGPSYYNQFGHHALLLLATGGVPGATAEERSQYLGLALRNIEYVLSITDAEFHTPHYSRGREWGRHIGEWLNYYLLGSLGLMERHQLGTRELRERLGAAVFGATAELHRRFVARYREAPTEFVGNHDTWHGLLFFAAGRHFNRPEWMEYARDFFARCVLPFQSADGYWPEGHGVVVGYAQVTAQAVSLYAETSGDAAALACLGRFAGFLDHLSFPDGSNSVALDVRMRYYASPFVFLPPSLLRGADGRMLLARRLPASRAHLARKGVRDNSAQVFAFFGSFAEMIFATDLTAQAPITLEAPTTLPAARLRRGAWQAYLSWQVVPEHPSRFVLDSQNHLEIWHERAGYVAGTGGSKYMPRFSTVRRTNAGRAYIATAARCVQATVDQAEVAYAFGTDEVIVGVAIVEGRCEISARVAQAEPGVTYEFGLLLPFRPGETLVSEHGTERLDPTVLVHHQGGPRPQRELRWRGLAWALPPGAQLDYPVVPHNSYTQDGLPQREDYVARLGVPLTARATVIRITEV
jgi:hypothetical protein